MAKPKTTGDKNLLIIWAADCAERVLQHFEKKFPNNDKPRKAIEKAREFIKRK